jgi:hypothetical protein
MTDILDQAESKIEIDTVQKRRFEIKLEPFKAPNLHRAPYLIFTLGPVNRNACREIDKPRPVNALIGGLPSSILPTCKGREPEYAAHHVWT